MKSSIIYIFCCFLLQFLFLTVSGKQVNISNRQSRSNDFYIGAVVDYAPYFSAIISAQKNILRSIMEYEKYIKEAKNQGADIIVFPEYGLTSTMITQSRLIANEYASEIPHPSSGVNPCRENLAKKNENQVIQSSEILYEISCAARRNQIYVVINLPERVQIKNKNDYVLYNTNIVFDREGTIVSRYRKYNLYNEFAFNSTDLPEYESFTTDFGVTFGIMTCFDILYADPTLYLIQNRGVTDLLFPTAWMSKMPFLSAIQTQAGLVKAYGINLLASNYNSPRNNLGGSGIYSPSGILNYTVPLIKESKMLLAQVPKIQISPKKNMEYNSKEKSKSNNEQRDLYLNTLTERWDGFTTEILDSNYLNNKMICNEDLCCYFTLNSLGESDYYYRLIANSQYRSSANRHHVQMCGIVACTDENVESCGKRFENVNNSITFTNVNITGNFIMNGNYVQIPSIVNYNLSTLDFDSYSYITASEGNIRSTISVEIHRPVDRILGISIYGRTRA